MYKNSLTQSSTKKIIFHIKESETLGSKLFLRVKLKNPAYGRESISRPMRIVAQNYSTTDSLELHIH